jgi:hypothetical protein
LFSIIIIYRIIAFKSCKKNTRKVLARANQSFLSNNRHVNPSLENIFIKPGPGIDPVKEPDPRFYEPTRVNSGHGLTFWINQVLPGHYTGWFFNKP